MPKPVILTGMCRCSFGLSPAPIIILPLDLVFTPILPMGSIMDHIPLLNILPFGMCRSLANPVVLSATIAAKGVLRPMPCVPITPAPWIPTNPKVQIRGKPILLNDSKTTCIWGGVIQIATPGVTLITA